MVYVTFRLADSLPQTLLKQWRAERDLWLKHNPQPWNEDTKKSYARSFQGPIEKWLDAGHGSCALRDPALRSIVSTALHHFDGERYALDAFVVMPNHVHALVVPFEESDTGFPACDADQPSKPTPEITRASISNGCSFGNADSQPGKAVSHSLSSILQSWKGCSAREINRLTGGRGQFWMDENFNHLVRSDAQRLHFRNYIRENPAKAFLRDGAWTHWESDTARPGCAHGSQTEPTPDIAGDPSFEPPSA